MKTKNLSRSASLRRSLFTCFFALLTAFFGLIFCMQPATLSASAASTPAFVIQNYDVDVTIDKNREISFFERLTVHFYRVGRKKEFYRSFPLEGDQFYDFDVKGINNPLFDYYIADNPDVEGFMDVNMTGGVEVGATLTYEISYKSLLSVADVKNGMRLDVIGSGWFAEIYDVDVTMHFPAAVTAYDVYSGAYGDEENGSIEYTLAEDGKTLTLSTDLLPLAYNSTYNETMAEGITVEFALEKGGLVSPFISQFFTKRMLVIAIVGVIAVAASIFVFIGCRTKREIVTVVNVKAPNDMDPLFMGKAIDASVDDEDITSMIYYFANKGWLNINLDDPKDAILIRRVQTLPYGTPVYVSTLFEGLFAGSPTVKISSLANRYYVYIDKAKIQLSAKDVPRYEKKSSMGLLICALLAVAMVVLIPYVFGKLIIGGDYANFYSAFMLLPLAVFFAVLYVRKDKWYKLKKSAKIVLSVAAVVIAAFSALIYSHAFATQVMSAWEKVVLLLFACILLFVGVSLLSRTERYNQLLGDILGFKDFIVYTEKEKIKFMLEDNPQLMYDILPYAQVLGVTDEWEDKFKDILIEKPSWCVGSNAAAYNYFVINRYMRASTRIMQVRPQSSGSSVGRSGGGGGRGGFSGGGRGGGGGGVR